MQFSANCQSPSDLHIILYRNQQFNTSPVKLVEENKKPGKHLKTKQIDNYLCWRVPCSSFCCSVQSQCSEWIATQSGCIEGVHHFLPECIAFDQSALRDFLSECIAPQISHHRAENQTILQVSAQYLAFECQRGWR